MGIAEIKETAKSLSDKERRELVAFLIHLEEGRDTSGHLDHVTSKIDETEKYVRWEDVEV